MATRRRAQQQYLASQNAANAARRQALQRAQAAPAAKGVVRPVQPGAPPAATPPGQPQAPGGQFTPDAQYLAEAAQRQFERSQAMTQLTSTGENDKTDTAEALRRLLQKAPEQRQGIKEGANRAGLFYSGQLGKQLNEYEANLAQSQGDINLDYQRREDARAAARKALEQGAPIEEAAGLAESATRRVQSDTEAADAGGLVPPAAVPAPAVPRVAAPPRLSQAARARRMARARARSRRR